MADERHYPAQYAARLLGYPKRQRTFIRRAQEALRRGDARVYKVGRNYFAPLSFWQAVRLRPAGRPPNNLPALPPLPSERLRA
jgi:hypothetical protein